jgi:protein-S-isoprenylcysteine O-methyltransferase Ste14
MNYNSTGEASPIAAAGPTLPMWRKVLRAGGLILLPLLCLFLAAGRLDWLEAWLYSGVYVAFTLASRFIMAQKHPDLLAERAQSMSLQGAKEWDRPLVLIIAVLGPILVAIVAGLDKRFGWSASGGAAPVESVFQSAAFVVLVLSFAWGSWALIVNRFFSGVVRIQTERNHQVVSNGPYRFMRHPGYAGAIVANLAGPVFLGTLWALVPAVLVSAVLVYRTWREDETLVAELPGYTAYAQRVRNRLLPGIW